MVNITRGEVWWADNLVWADAPGNVVLEAKVTGLPKDSVANVSQSITLDWRSLTEQVGKIQIEKMDLILAGIAIILGRE